MKTRLLFTLLLAFLFSFSRAGQGGPDLYGYTWKDNFAPGGPAYQWVNIATPENRISGLADDNSRGPFSLYSVGQLSDFYFYWYPVDQIWIGSNGYVSFNSVNLASVFPDIPDSLDNKHNFIAGLLTDLSFGGTNNPGQCYLRVGADSVIISFINVPFYAQSAPYWSGSNTFQIILDKNDFSITVNYQSQNGTAYTSTDVKAGIENITGTLGLKPFSATYPTAGYCIKYYRPETSTYLISDGAVRYNSLPQNRAYFLPKSAPFTLTSLIANMGNRDIPPLVSASGKIFDAVGGNPYYDVYYITDTLFIGQNTLISYPSAFTPAQSGTYSYTSRLYGVLNDAVALNDSAVQELVVVDTSLSIYSLAFCDDTPDLTGISWVDGTGGVGVYFQPLTYPVKISSVQFQVTSNSSGTGCFIKIFDDDGPGNTAGSLLDSVLVTSPNVGSWTTVNYTNPVIVNSGGFYVGWEMNGTGVIMGVDRTPPISHRTFEVISGAWAEYRDGLTQDFMIRCTVEKTLSRDLSVTAILSPNDGDTVSSATPVSCRIRNNGLTPLTTFPVRYGFNGQTLVTGNYNGAAILPGDSLLFTFSVPFTPNIILNADLCVWTDLPYDVNPGNDLRCVNIYSQVLSGLEEDIHPEIRVFPNPFTSAARLEITGITENKARMQIMDMTGRMVRENELDGNKGVSLEKGQLYPGIYLLRIISPARDLKTRIVIQ